MNVLFSVPIFTTNFYLVHIYFPTYFPSIALFIILIVQQHIVAVVFGLLLNRFTVAIWHYIVTVLQLKNKYFEIKVI